MTGKRQRMGYVERKPKYRWRDYLTDAEAERMQAIEESPRPSPAMRLEHQQIRNRAVQRARYAVLVKGSK